MTEQSLEALKPCPFCSNLPEPSSKRGWVSCRNANCPASVIHTTHETWNTRAPANNKTVVDRPFKILSEPFEEGSMAITVVQTTHGQMGPEEAQRMLRTTEEKPTPQADGEKT